ncbi:ATP-grasp domain-containing protein [Patescibacteria group bacterium]|nr:ATP-grasp domain-containing protein [Patescibacteria group bacterium]
MSAPALVLDGSLQSALAATRSLARHGAHVICGAERSSAMALHSKYCAERFLYRSPLKDLAGFLDDLETFLRRQPESPVLFTFSDLTFLPIARQRERFASLVRFPLSSPDSVEIAFDKSKTCELAKQCDIPTPRTDVVETVEAAEQIFTSATSYPCILKPRHSCIWKTSTGEWGKVQKVQNIEEATIVWRQTTGRFSESPLIQEFVDGEEFGIFFLASDGKPLATFAHHRLRSFDVSGGASVLRESIDPPSDMLGYSQRLIESLHWSGPVMVEWKRDAKTQKPVLMEINGRFWGSLPLAIAAGVDFPWLIYQQIMMGKIDETPAFTRGIRSRQLLGDVRHLIGYLFSTSPSIDGQKRWNAVKEFCRFQQPGLSYDVESWDDWKPSLWQVVDQISKKL